MSQLVFSICQNCEEIASNGGEGVELPEGERGRAGNEPMLPSSASFT